MSQAEIDPTQIMRDSNQAEWERTAEVNNADRPFYKRALGLGAATSYAVMLKEAYAENNRIDADNEKDRIRRFESALLRNIPGTQYLKADLSDETLTRKMEALGSRLQQDVQTERASLTQINMSRTAIAANTDTVPPLSSTHYVSCQQLELIMLEQLRASGLVNLRSFMICDVRQRLPSVRIDDQTRMEIGDAARLLSNELGIPEQRVPRPLAA